MIDERLTTVVAEAALRDADVSRAKRKQVIDQAAATILLQTFLDHRAGR
jgi:putative Holliday junction resolvase